MAAKALPDAECLRNRFAYDPETGVLTRKSTGKPTGSMKNPGLAVWVDNGSFLAHRIIWKMVYGLDPDEIDHIDHDRANNRLSNLRSVTRAENMKNRPAYKNSTGHVGVYWHKATGKWSAEIQNNGERHHLGLFKSLEDAIAARADAEINHGFHPNHGRTQHKAGATGT